MVKIPCRSVLMPTSIQSQFLAFLLWALKYWPFLRSVARVRRLRRTCDTLLKLTILLHAIQRKSHIVHCAEWKVYVFVVCGCVARAMSSEHSGQVRISLKDGKILEWTKCWIHEAKKEKCLLVRRENVQSLRVQ